MKSSQSIVVERLHQALNEHNLETLLACFAPSFQGEQPLHPARAFEELSKSVKIGQSSSRMFRTFTPSYSV